MAPFHKTGYARRFFEKQLPDLIKALERIADALEKDDDDKEEKE